MGACCQYASIDCRNIFFSFSLSQDCSENHCAVFLCTGQSVWAEGHQADGLFVPLVKGDGGAGMHKDGEIFDQKRSHCLIQLPISPHPLQTTLPPDLQLFPCFSCSLFSDPPIFFLCFFCPSLHAHFISALSVQPINRQGKYNDSFNKVSLRLELTLQNKSVLLR